MRLVIDGRPLIQKKAGIGAYTAEFISHFADRFPEWQIIIISPKRLHSSVESIVNKSNVTIDICPVLGGKLPNMVWFYFYSAIRAKKYRADYFVSTVTQYPFFLGKIKYVMTVNDFVVKDFAYTMTLRNRLSSFFFDYSINRAKNIWCISHYTQQQLIDRYPHKVSAQYFIGITVSDIYKRINIFNDERRSLMSQYGINNSFIMFVGSLEPRKNLKFLLKLSPEIYKRARLQTLIVGSARWKSDIENEVKDGSVIVVDKFVDDEDLVKLYNISSCYVSTSLNEGFGMPQLEALKCGCPVVSPRNSAMIEVVEGRGKLVVGWNEHDWLRAICEESQKGHQDYCLEEYAWDNKVKEMHDFLLKI